MFPVAGAPCRPCDKVCKKLLNVAPLPDFPSAASRLSKLFFKVSRLEFDALDPVLSVSEEDDDDNCEMRFCKPLSSFPMPPP